MTVETATNFTISHTIDRDIVEEIEATFEGFRSRIALLSVEACGTLTSMFTPLGPVDTEVIDIEAIEWEQFELELVAAEDHSADATVLEFAAA